MNPLRRNPSGGNTEETGSGQSKTSRSIGSTVRSLLRGTSKRASPPKLDPPPTVSGETPSDTEHGSTYQNFDSRQEAYNKLMKALEQGGDTVIGIYGLPGVGKSLMMQQARRQAKDKKIFNKVMIAHVGREVNVKNIKDQLDGNLNSHLVSKDEESDAASQVENSLNEGASTLVILDDVWDAIPLEEIGIPIVDGGHTGYKILLTARTRDICLRNNCKDPIEIKKLTAEEAKKMFRNTVGIPEIDSLYNDLVEDVCRSCECLPLLIRAVGSAFKCTSIDLWKEEFEQIDYGRFGWIDGIEPQVYACLQMSFYKLEEDVRICLLLCALFPESAVIDLEMLSDFATGSDPLLKPKEEIREYINRLKSYYLLVQDNDYCTIRIPIIIRDVARSVAARDPDYAFSGIRCKLWLPDNVDYSTRRVLHLDLQGDNVGFPSDQVSPYLRFLWLECNNQQQRLSGGLFTTLKCLLIKGMVFSENQWPADSMRELRTLILDGCNLHVTFLCFIPDYLQTLRIRECHFPDPEDHGIPKEKVLGDLITVEISRCKGSKFLFPAAAAKSLEKLEELIIERCGEMEEIVSVDGSTDGEVICFPKLKLLMLDDMPKLTQFYKHKITSSSISFFSEKVEFPLMKKPMIRKEGYETHVWGPQGYIHKEDEI